MLLPSAVTCRLYLPADLPALYAIEEVCFAPPLRFSRSLMRSLAEDPDCRTWLGMLNGVRAGFAMVGLTGDKNPNAAYIYTLEVLPVFRRRGVARELLRHLEESASAAKRPAMELHVSQRNVDALALYELSGYKRIGALRDFYGKGQDGFRYWKPLTGDGV